MVKYWIINYPEGVGSTSYPVLYRKVKRIPEDDWWVVEVKELGEPDSREAIEHRDVWELKDPGKIQQCPPSVYLGGEKNEYWVTMGLQSAWDLYDSTHKDIEIPDESEEEEDSDQEVEVRTYYPLRHPKTEKWKCDVGYTNMQEYALKVEALRYIYREPYWSLRESVDIEDENSESAQGLRRDYEDQDGGLVHFADGYFVTKGLKDAIDEREDAAGEVNVDHTPEDIVRIKEEWGERSDDEDEEMEEDESEEESEDEDDEMGEDESEEEYGDEDNEMGEADDLPIPSWGRN